MTARVLRPALLERWMRLYYFDTDIDIGSSGVEPFSFAELRDRVGITLDELDEVVLRDSQTLGESELRQAVADRWGNGNLNRVMVTNGSSEAIYLIMNALLQAGDEVLVIDPCYQQLCSTAEAIGCRIRRWPLRPENGFHPDLEEIGGLMSPKTRMVVVNFPHNPTGAALSVREEDYLIGKVAATGAHLVWDRAFSDLTYETASAFKPKMQYEREIDIGTLSKAYGLPGLRLGWCIASPEILDLCAHFRDYISLHMSPLTELVARRSIEQGDVLLKLRMEQARMNRNLTAEWIAEHAELAEWTPPQGGVCGFPRLRHVPDTEAFCHGLAREHRVLLVPGNCFDMPGHVRLGFGGATADLQEGLGRLSEALIKASLIHC